MTEKPTPKPAPRARQPRPAPESQPPADDADELAQLRALRERVLAVQRGDGDLRWLGVLDACDYILGDTPNRGGA